MPILEKQPPLSPGPVGFLLGCFFTVSQPNRILRGNLEYFKKSLESRRVYLLGCLFKYLCRISVRGLPSRRYRKRCYGTRSVPTTMQGCAFWCIETWAAAWAALGLQLILHFLISDSRVQLFLSLSVGTAAVDSCASLVACIRSSRQPKGLGKPF